jgi:hypothetical protein
MGIDLLENSELAALAPSRLGNKSFVDDSNYSNFSFVNKSKAERDAREQLNILWEINPKYKNDCDYLQKQLDKLLIEIDAENKKGYNADLRRRFINPREDAVAKYKKAITDNECQKNKEAAEKAYEQKNTLDTLTTITNAPPSLIPDGEKKADNTNKYIIYGVGGVILLIAVAILIKK